MILGKKSKEVVVWGCKAKDRARRVGEPMPKAKLGWLSKPVTRNVITSI